MLLMPHRNLCRNKRLRCIKQKATFPADLRRGSLHLAGFERSSETAMTIMALISSRPASVVSIAGHVIILLAGRTRRQCGCRNAIRRIYSIAEYLFQVEAQVVSILEITLMHEGLIGSSPNFSEQIYGEVYRSLLEGRSVTIAQTSS